MHNNPTAEQIKQEAERRAELDPRSRMIEDLTDVIDYALRTLDMLSFYATDEDVRLHATVKKMREQIGNCYDLIPAK